MTKCIATAIRSPQARRRISSEFARYAAVPMLKEGEPIGAIAIYRTEVKLFGEKEIIMTVRPPGGPAIENRGCLTVAPAHR